MDSKILSSEIVPSNKKTSISKVKITEVQKEGLSLFDSILAKNNTNSKKTEIKNNTTPSSKKETANVKSEDKSKSSLNSIKPQMSLLDKMVKDIKIDTKNINTKNVENEKVKINSKLSKDTVKDNIDSSIKNTNTNTKTKEIKIKDELQKAPDLTKQKDIVKNSIVEVSKEVKIISPKKENISKELKHTKEQASKTVDLTTDIKKETSNISNEPNITIPKDSLLESLINNAKISKDIKNEIVSPSEESKIEIPKGSLLESLTKSIKVSKETKDDDIKIKKNSSKQSTSTSIDSTVKVDTKNPLQATIFLSNQQTQKEIISKQKINESKEIIQNEPKTAKNLQKSADILELNASKSEIKKELVSTNKKEEKVQSLKTKENLKEQMNKQNNMLNKMFLNKKVDNENLAVLKDIDVKQVKTSSEIKSKTTEEVTKQKDVEIVVEQTVAQSMVTKIVESKQKMNSFMSDVARNMYLNYKPPVTSFKINLNPLNLGNIAITMKSNKATNSISVSLNMSQNATLETFSENKNALQNALNKIFSQDTSFSLNFSMQGDNSNNSFEQFNEQQNNKNNNKNEKLENIDENKEIEQEKSYM